MNERDSEHILAELHDKKGFEETIDIKEADVIIINTCSVRERPVKKLFSEIGRYNKLKKPGAKIGVCGCTASHLGEEILKKSKNVSFVLGARQVSKITAAVEQEGFVEVGIDYDDTLYPFSAFRRSPFKAMINISVGCDKSCSYCIVPATRGKEISIPPKLIIDEAKRVVDEGVSEILLLGQNVNSYGVRFSEAGVKSDFTALLREVTKIAGLKRVRFTSPHPLHMDDAFIEEFAANPKICNNIHMPLQSGSTKVLKDMRRGYSQEWFLKKAAKIRELAPDATISTDVIVAYPTETEADFQETLDVIQEVKFEHMYSFVFSPRPLTEAESLKSDISEDEAKERLEKAQAIQKEAAIKMAEGRIGKKYEVLVEGKNESGLLEGRSENNYLIRMEGDEKLSGTYVDVEVAEARGASLFGKIV